MKKKIQLRKSSKIREQIEKVSPRYSRVSIFLVNKKLIVNKPGEHALKLMLFDQLSIYDYFKA